MLSSFPALTEDEFRNACEEMQKRCTGQLDDTDWLDIKWHQGALTIRKAYHVDLLERMDDTKIYEPDDQVLYLGGADDEDDVRILQVSCERR